MHINTVTAAVVSSRADDMGPTAWSADDRYTRLPHERTRLIPSQPYDSYQAPQRNAGRRASSASSTTYASALSDSASETVTEASSRTLVPGEARTPGRWARCKRWLACVICCHVPT